LNPKKMLEQVFALLYQSKKHSIIKKINIRQLAEKNMADKKSTILIVEDEIDLRQLMKKKLINEGFNVLEADNGEIGLQIALTQHPDIILLDIVMPIMDGLSMLKGLRQNEWGKDAMVIILSNLSEAEKIDQGMEKNVYDYLVKSDREPDDIVNLIKQKIIERAKR